MDKFNNRLVTDEETINELKGSLVENMQHKGEWDKNTEEWVRDTGESVRSSNLHINELAEQEEKMRQDEHWKDHGREISKLMKDLLTDSGNPVNSKQDKKFFKAYLLINTLQTVEQQSKKS